MSELEVSELETTRPGSMKDDDDDDDGFDSHGRPTVVPRCFLMDLSYFLLIFMDLTAMVVPWSSR